MAKTNPADPVSQNRFIGLAQTFLRMEASGGIALVVMAVLAIIVANSPLYAFYDFFLRQMTFTIGFSDYSKSVDFQIHKPLQLWINDGLMAVFFLLVGLEIKREFVSGELSSRSRALLPFLGAIGGMAVPALIYCYINKDTPPNLAGWAIPSATDIAFALGVLALLGSRAPASLKVLLMAIAVIDDLGAIIIIALFYTEQLSVPPLVFSFLCLGVMALLKMKRVTNVVPYLLVGLVMWASVLESGVHATLAGVATALFIPMHCNKKPGHSPCEALIHGLHPWVAFMVLPLFAFANAGVPLTGMGLHSLFDPVTLGIIAGLLIGKQIGVFGLLFFAIKSGLSPMLKDTTWLHIYGVSLLCGIGFTMSLFIGSLAFDDLTQQASIRLGVLTGSVLSAIVGATILYFAPAKKPEKTDA